MVLIKYVKGPPSDKTWENERWWNDGWFLLFFIAMFGHFKIFRAVPHNRKTLKWFITLPYIFQASSTVCLLSMISLLNFIISLRISSSSFLASRVFLFFSSCTKYWASRKADFFKAFSILWNSSSFSRLMRFSFTLKRI